MQDGSGFNHIPKQLRNTVQVHKGIDQCLALMALTPVLILDGTAGL
jgi:hypothetical protein